MVSYNPGYGSKKRQDIWTKRWTDEQNPDTISQTTNKQQFGEIDGAVRAQIYSSNWEKASLRETVEKLTPGATPKKSEDGEKIYYTSADGKTSIVHDIKGNYFRVRDNTFHSRRNWTDLERNRMENYSENGVNHGRKADEYQRLTHFLNTDKEVPHG